jgi:glycosyltransferase involved in cell wall biosynthesis
MGGLWPLTSGGRQRSFHTLRELSRRHRVALVTTEGAGEDTVGLSTALGPGVRVHAWPVKAAFRGSVRGAAALANSWLSREPAALSKWRVDGLRRLAAEVIAAHTPDVVIADFLYAVPSLPSRMSAPVVLFEHNVEYVIWRRLATLERRPLHRAVLELEWRKMRACERRAVARSTATIAVSAADRDQLSAEVPRARVFDIPTGVDLEFFQPAPEREVADRLVFSGSMDWFPNEDAMGHFADKIWPAILAARPNATLTIVGRQPTAKVRALTARPGITVTGTVDDVRPHVQAAAVFIVPLRAGGGTRLKILEALAMGKAIVSTSIGAEGLDLRDGVDGVLADGDAAFARAVTALLGDPGRRRELGVNGRARVEADCGWPRVASVFEGHLQAVVTGTQADAPALEPILEAAASRQRS